MHFSALVLHMRHMHVGYGVTKTYDRELDLQFRIGDTAGLILFSHTLLWRISKNAGSMNQHLHVFNTSQ